jgi:flagellar motor switch/type III secretory pathway protein FliN
MLGLPIGAHKLRSGDLRLFSALAAACAEDLMRALGHAFGAPQAPQRTTTFQCRDRDTLRYSLSVGAATQVFDLFVARSRAVLARKAAIGGAPRCPPVRPRSEAIERQQIRVGALVGKVRLGLSEFWSLEHGDVLVLDRAQGEAFELTVDGRLKPSVRCELRHDGRGLETSMARTEQAR